MKFDFAEYQRSWVKKNPHKLAEYQAKYRSKNLDTCLERERKWRSRSKSYCRNKRLQDLYGITIEQYDTILGNQGGVCAICGGAPGDKRRLAVDHCHHTGRVRGLLCFGCNSAIGKLGDTADKVARAVKYLLGGEI